MAHSPCVCCVAVRQLVCGWRTVVDGDRDVGLWLALFPLLHLLRLAETALLVLTKRPVSFLHGESGGPLGWSLLLH